MAPTAREFLRALFGEDQDHGWILTWKLQTKLSQFFADPESAGNWLQQEGLQGDVYFGCALRVSGLPPEKRGEADQCTAIGSVWADLDYASAHTSKNYPDGLVAVQKILDRCGALPSALFQTGGGAQAHWFLSELWDVTDPAQRKDAANVLMAWQETLASHAAQAGGWDIDRVHDLPRVLRCPGTMNHKYDGDPIPVRVEIWDPDRRYHVDDIRDRSIAPQYAGKDARGMVTVPAITIDEDLPPTKATELAQHDTRFELVWNNDPRAKVRDKTPSGFDFAIAREGVYHDWTDQEIAQAIWWWRKIHGKNPDKIRRHKYLSTTIGNARSERRPDVATDAATEKIEAEVPVQRDEALDYLSKIFGLPVVRWHMMTSDPEEYFLTVVHNGLHLPISIGTAGAAMRHGSFEEALFRGARHVCRLPGKRWKDVLKILALIQEDVEVPESSREGRVIRWLRDYIYGQPWKFGDPRAAIREDQPCRRDGKIGIHVPTFRGHIKRFLSEQPTGLYNRLKQLGFRNQTCRIDKTTKSYHWIDERLLQELCYGTESDPVDLGGDADPDTDDDRGVVAVI